MLEAQTRRGGLCFEIPCTNRNLKSIRCCLSCPPNRLALDWNLGVAVALGVYFWAFEHRPIHRLCLKNPLQGLVARAAVHCFRRLLPGFDDDERQLHRQRARLDRLDKKNPNKTSGWQIIAARWSGVSAITRTRAPM